ncbi:GspE/PulE family protein [Tumebacillus lipolyticus]|uniref:GspE/PulE family protein n=1 Tax=Tumebacillus lipolyticus TaxID=1280370 RepID=A0ABW4ZSN1_9BACL
MSHDEGVTADVLDLMLAQAYREGASDVHIEPWHDEGCRVRVRMNGRLEMWDAPDVTLKQTVSKLKLRARMDIAERRLPQDGSFQVQLPEGEVFDVRVSSLPTVHGEKVALRLLQNRARHALDELGFDPGQRRLFNSWIEARHGMVLVTGPTGSGKTTTLYAAMLQRREAGLNLSTLENPVEVKLPGINQVEIQPKTGLSFDLALRSVLRQDPDVLMIGEIRDEESAGVAARAALTGHLVLTSLHSESAVGALLRLIDLGVPPQVLATGLRGVVGQRLVETSEGKRAVFECVPMTDGIRQALYQKADVRELSRQARKESIRLLPDVLSDWLERGAVDEQTVDRIICERGMI